MITQVQLQIERVDENMFLEVIIDDKLSCKSHIKHLHNKLSRSVLVLNKTKLILDHKSPHMLYSALILPHLNYCSEV